MSAEAPQSAPTDLETAAIPNPEAARIQEPGELVQYAANAAGEVKLAIDFTEQGDTVRLADTDQTIVIVRGDEASGGKEIPLFFETGKPPAQFSFDNPDDFRLFAADNPETVSIGEPLSLHVQTAQPGVTSTEGFGEVVRIIQGVEGFVDTNDTQDASFLRKSGARELSQHNLFAEYGEARDKLPYPDPTAASEPEPTPEPAPAAPEPVDQPATPNDEPASAGEQTQRPESKTPSKAAKKWKASRFLAKLITGQDEWWPEYNKYKGDLKFGPASNFAKAMEAEKVKEAAAKEAAAQASPSSTTETPLATLDEEREPRGESIPERKKKRRLFGRLLGRDAVRHIVIKESDLDEPDDDDFAPRTIYDSEGRLIVDEADLEPPHRELSFIDPHDEPYVTPPVGDPALIPSPEPQPDEDLLAWLDAPRDPSAAPVPVTPLETLPPRDARTRRPRRGRRGDRKTDEETESGDDTGLDSLTNLQF